MSWIFFNTFNVISKSFGLL